MDYVLNILFGFSLPWIVYFMVRGQPIAASVVIVAALLLLYVRQVESNKRTVRLIVGAMCDAVQRRD
jgi:hypothetical protein